MLKITQAPFKCFKDKELNTLVGFLYLLECHWIHAFFKDTWTGLLVSVIHYYAARYFNYVLGIIVNNTSTQSHITTADLNRLWILVYDLVCLNFKHFIWILFCIIHFIYLWNWIKSEELCLLKYISLLKKICKCIRYILNFEQFTNLIRIVFALTPEWCM